MMAFALDHVQIAIPPGSEDEARAFYSTLLGLRELDRPAILTGRSGCWYDLGQHQLHLGADADFHPARKAHVALTTDSLAALRGRLADAGCPIFEDVPLPGRTRFFTEDPFGNRLELIQLG